MDRLPTLERVTARCRDRRRSRRTQPCAPEYHARNMLNTSSRASSTAAGLSSARDLRRQLEVRGRGSNSIRLEAIFRRNPQQLACLERVSRSRPCRPRRYKAMRLVENGTDGPVPWLFPAAPSCTKEKDRDRPDADPNPVRRTASGFTWSGGYAQFGWALTSSGGRRNVNGRSPRPVWRLGVPIRPCFGRRRRRDRMFRSV